MDIYFYLAVAGIIIIISWRMVSALPERNGTGNSFPYCHGRCRILCLSASRSGWQLLKQGDRTADSDYHITSHCMYSL